MLNSKSNKFVILSIALHTSLAVGLTQVNPEIFEPLPEGTVASVEFTTVEPNYGQQVETTDVGEVEDSEPVVEKAPEPVEEIKAEPQPETEIATELPPPVEVKQAEVEPLPEPETPQVDVVETETVEESPVEVNTPEEEQALTEEVAKEEPKEMLPVSEDEEFADIAEKEVHEAVDSSEEPAEEVDEKSETPEAVAATPATEKADAETTKQSVAAKPANENISGESFKSNMNYGVPTGVRDVKDLRQAAGNVPPQYPQTSRLRRETGKVKLMYYVTPDGRVTNLKLLRSSGHQALDKEAVNAISRYRFFPGQQGYTSHIVNFELKGQAKPAGGRLRFRSTN